MSLTLVTVWERECREGEMWESWRALGTEEGLIGWLLQDLAVGTQGRGTGALGGYGVLWGHGSLGAQQGYLDLHTCGTRLHERDVDE